MRTEDSAQLAPSLDLLRASGLLALVSGPKSSDKDMEQPVNIAAPTNDTSAKKIEQFRMPTEGQPPRIKVGDKAAAQRKGPDFLQLDKLLVDHQKHTADLFLSNANERSIHQAPLLAADLVTEHYKDLVPQYGLLGSLEVEEKDATCRQLFLNTNVPFSTFICGVQGSGKSHTTACILENAVLSSPNIGHLESPVSTLVFSYGEWSSGGGGFNISEATFLGASYPNFPGCHVKQVNVLHSPSNPAIKKLYECIPNVKTVPFKLKVQTLDIRALHALMAMDEKSSVPLYMTRVEAILRDIASKSQDGSLNYAEFRRRLKKEKFDSTQKTMLELCTNLLESFLDLNGTIPEPEFKSGEVNIIDLSDAFLTPSTACILFKLGLERFLQSRVPGKMVVLDEAHKVLLSLVFESYHADFLEYMSDTPGSRMLTEHLTKVIRLQRHQGARVVISTQEPTTATELIALCSVIVIHRFTSPAWYAAIKQHINAVNDDKAIMEQIESLETGEALVYAPNAVLRKNDAGSLVKATGRLLKVKVRNRVTLDGGASIMAI